VTIYLVAVHHDAHTCPADAKPHPYSTTRSVLDIIEGGPCRTPVTIRVGTTTATIACGRHEPADRQCGACRTIVTEQAITATHHGAASTAHTAAPGGLATRPCQSCRQPLAAVLADLGHHITCHPIRAAA